MKAIVVQIKGKYVAVLSDDGCVMKLRNNHYKKGQVIEMKGKKWWNTGKAAACAAVVVLCAGTGAYTYAMPYSYVSLDVNPSIEYTLNRFDKVLEVKAVNDDGEEIVKELELAHVNHKPIRVVIDATVAELMEEDFFEEGDEYSLIIAVSSQNAEKSEKMAKKLEERVEKDGAHGDVEAISVGRERVEKARKLHTTPGRLNLVEKLAETDENLGGEDVEYWLKQPVRDIMKATNENKADARLEAKEDAAEVKKSEAKKSEDKESRTTEREERTDRPNEKSKEVKAEEKADIKDVKDDAKTEIQNARKDAKDGSKEEQAEVKADIKESRAEAKEKVDDIKNDAKKAFKDVKAEEKVEKQAQREEEPEKSEDKKGNSKEKKEKKKK